MSFVNKSMYGFVELFGYGDDRSSNSIQYNYQIYESGKRCHYLSLIVSKNKDKDELYLHWGSLLTLIIQD